MFDVIEHRFNYVIWQHCCACLVPMRVCVCAGKSGSGRGGRRAGWECEHERFCLTTEHFKHIWCMDNCVSNRNQSNYRFIGTNRTQIQFSQLFQLLKFQTEFIFAPNKIMSDNQNNSLALGIYYERADVGTMLYYNADVVQLEECHSYRWVLFQCSCTAKWFTSTLIPRFCNVNGIGINANIVHASTQLPTATQHTSDKLAPHLHSQSN